MALSFIIYALISTFALSSPLAVDAAVHRVAHTDPQVQFIPSTCDLDCTRVCRNQWWLSCLSDGSSSHRTKGNNTSSNFSFKGSSVTWYTRTANDGGKAVVYIDGKYDKSIDTNTPTVNEANPLYTKSGLDPTTTHTISVLFDIAAFTEAYERFVDVRYFEYDDGIGSGAPITSQTTPTLQGSTASSSSTSTGSGSSTSGTRTNSGSTTSNSTTNPSLTTSAVFLTPGLVTLSNGTIQTAVSANNASTGAAPSDPKISIGSIAAIVLGALIALCLCAVAVFFVKRRRQGRPGVILEPLIQGPSSAVTSGTNSRPISLVSRSRSQGGGDPNISTDTFFHNIRDSHFYQLRNPQPGNVRPIYAEGSNSKHRLAALTDRNFPEVDETDGASATHSMSPLSTLPRQPSGSPQNVIYEGTGHNLIPNSPDSGTRMTTLSRESPREAHAYSMAQDSEAQDSEARHLNRSSAGTWLPSTPPPQYIR